MSFKDELEELEVENEVDDMDNELEQEIEIEEGKTTSKKKKKGKGKRIIALALAVTMGGTGLFAFKNNIKVANADDTDEILGYVKDDNTASNEEVSRNINEESISNLETIRTYLKLSNMLDKLYQTYNGRITNLTLGEAKINEGTIVSLTADEINQLYTDLCIIADTPKNKQDDDYYQKVKEVIEYSSQVNAWLAYNANVCIYNTIKDNITNDVASSLNKNYSIVSSEYDVENEKLSIIRGDNGVGEASYPIPLKGKRALELEDILVNSYREYTEIEGFLNSGEQSLYDEDAKCLMTISGNSGLVVYRNADVNNNVGDAISEIQLMLCSDHKIENTEFSYNYRLPGKRVADEVQTEESYTSSTSVSAMIRTLKK